MAMVGHKTESIYRRYAIVDDGMHREAATLDAWTTEQKMQARRPSGADSSRGSVAGKRSEGLSRNC